MTSLQEQLAALLGTAVVVPLFQECKISVTNGTTQNRLRDKILSNMTVMDNALHHIELELIWVEMYLDPDDIEARDVCLK
jgi:hypothetical protein